MNNKKKYFFLFLFLFIISFICSFTSPAVTAKTFETNPNDIKKIITKVEIKTVNGEKVIEVQLNNGLEKDFFTLSSEYNLHLIDF